MLEREARLGLREDVRDPAAGSRLERLPGEGIDEALGRDSVRGSAESVEREQLARSARERSRAADDVDARAAEPRVELDGRVARTREQLERGEQVIEPASPDPRRRIDRGPAASAASSASSRSVASFALG